MKRIAVAVILAVLYVPAWGQVLPAERQSGAQAAQTTEQELRALLNQFLAAAGTNDRAMFDRFFADDVIYTRNSGQTTTKAAMMRGLSQPAKPGDPKMSYSSQDVVVHDYGNVAVVNFVLVARSDSGEITNYRDTGTFLKRGGRWQVVAWQATKIALANK